MELIITYQIALIPISAAAIAQVLKYLINSARGRFSLKDMVAYSGMPSGHSALVVSLAATIGLSDGFDTSAFAISLILAIIVIRDALGIRRYLGQHGHILNILVQDLKNDEVLEHSYPHLLERIGHTPLQAIAGGSLGLAISLIGYWILH